MNYNDSGIHATEWNDWKPGDPGTDEGEEKAKTN